MNNLALIIMLIEYNNDKVEWNSVTCATKPHPNEITEALRLTYSESHSAQDGRGHIKFFYAKDKFSHR